MNNETRQQPDSTALPAAPGLTLQDAFLMLARHPFPATPPAKKASPTPHDTSATPPPPAENAFTKCS